MQQVNLFLPEFRPNSEPLRAIHMAWGLLFVFVLMLAVSLHTYRQHSQLAHQVAQVKQAQEALQAQLKILSAQKPVQTGTDLTAKIQKLQSDLQRRKQLSLMIASQNLGNNKGFSAQLMALANAVPSTLSIESFSLQNGGTYAELSGKARGADQVPLYLQKLRADPSFANVGFGVLNIERDEKSSEILDFTLAKTTDKNQKQNVRGER